LRAYRCLARPKQALGLVPMVQWLPQYSILASGLSDLIAGLTLGVLMIPQGLRSLGSSYIE
jgi:MFS superfamily sulfate permease-like transporter